MNLIVLGLVMAFISLAGTIPAYAQVDIQQSQSQSTTTINGHTSSITSDNGKTTVSTPHGFLKIDGDKIRYCHTDSKGQTCGPTYSLNSNGTITS